MGNCFCPHSRTSEAKVDREMRKQSEALKKTLLQFKDYSAELDRVTNLILVKIEFPKRYRGWSVDKFISEVYYKNLVPPKELQDICELFKKLAENVNPLLNSPEKQPEEFKLVVDEIMLVELKENRKKFTGFVEAAAKIPIIPEKIVLPSNSASIKEIAPSLVKSLSIH